MTNNSQLPTPAERSLLATIFISPSEPRLRVGWRLLIQTILLIILSALAGLIFYFISPSMILSSSLLIGELAELFAFVGSIYIARRFLDKRSFVSLGLKIDKHAMLDILAGIIITFIMMGAIFIVMQALGWLKFESFAWNTDPAQTVVSQILLFFIIFIIVGFNEEFLFRGYQLQTITSGLNFFLGTNYLIHHFRRLASRQSKRNLGQRCRHILCWSISGLRIYPHSATLAFDWPSPRMEFL